MERLPIREIGMSPGLLCPACSKGTLRPVSLHGMGDLVPSCDNCGKQFVAAAELNEAMGEKEPEEVMITTHPVCLRVPKDLLAKLQELRQSKNGVRAALFTDDRGGSLYYLLVPFSDVPKFMAAVDDKTKTRAELQAFGTVFAMPEPPPMSRDEP